MRKQKVYIRRILCWRGGSGRAKSNIKFRKIEQIKGSNLLKASETGQLEDYRLSSGQCQTPCLFADLEEIGTL